MSAGRPGGNWLQLREYVESRAERGASPPTLVLLAEMLPGLVTKSPQEHRDAQPLHSSTSLSGPGRMEPVSRGSPWLHQTAGLMWAAEVRFSRRGGTHPRLSGEAWDTAQVLSLRANPLTSEVLF